MTRRTIPSIFVAALAIMAVVPTSALGATTCARNGGVLEVAMSAHNDRAGLQTSGTVIRVFGQSGEVTCTSGATTANVDTVLVVDEADDPSTPAGNDGGTIVSISEPAAFAPGKTTETEGLSEIEFLVDTKGGDDRLTLGGNAPQQLIVGDAGAAWNGDADPDMLGMPFKDLVLFGADGADYLNARGGTGTGAPLSAAKKLQLTGNGGADTLTGSDIPGGDEITGGSGDDSIVAYAGSDLVAPGTGDDTVQGGPGTDSLDLDGDKPVQINLANTDRQDTGQGNDAFAQFENASGTAFADRMTGDSGPNVLQGGNGDDVLEGAGGADELQGEQGTDATSYANSATAVTVDLARTTQPTDGDKLFSVEDVTGSRLGDTLAGNAIANRIDPGPGTDTVSAGDGADQIAARDGQADQVVCGAGADSVVSDRRSLDVVNADCDSVDALPEPLQPVGRGTRHPAAGHGWTGAVRAGTVPRCQGRRATIVGTAGKDVLRGTRRADVIVGLGGNDRISAARGNDLVCGGAGNDRVSGGSGRDRLLGESGRDRLSGGAGRDRCSGGPGRDRAAGCERRTLVP